MVKTRTTLILFCTLAVLQKRIGNRDDFRDYFSYFSMKTYIVTPALELSWHENSNWVGSGVDEGGGAD